MNADQENFAEDPHAAITASQCRDIILQAQSPPELWLGKALLEKFYDSIGAGFIWFEPQAPIQGYVIDFALCWHRSPGAPNRYVIAIECDGRSYHSDPSAFSRDRRRDRTLLASDIPTLRFTAEECFRDAVRCADEVATQFEKIMGLPFDVDPSHPGWCEILGIPWGSMQGHRAAAR